MHLVFSEKKIPPVLPTCQIFREDVRGVAGVASATPYFGQIEEKILNKKIN